MRIVVRGIPAAQGSKRHVGGGRMVEMSRAVGPWREAVRAETQRAMNGDGPMQGPLRVNLLFTLPRPKSASRKVAYPAKRPDLDKLARAVLDGLTAGGAWADDGQVVTLVAHKRFPVGPAPGAGGCVISIETVEES